ncbi:RNA exonuclease 1 homolog [Ceratina calcarata]|uniref:RNA exonuclease 1 homolog n=1 Tax=Ceratina calcarata TaxID=156304 RepID=A0AAJ7J4J1_9HYME|nr:RNA exonuclease 1 homolog [Ceratina calcarata]
MLPSTGYFKTINCPFYDNGTCERPYCHFRHSKREDAGVAVEATEAVENRSADQVEGSKTNAIVASSSDVLQQLVTEAVQKVLGTRTVSDIDNLSCENVVSQVVEGLKPTLTPGSSSTLDNVSVNTGEKRTEPLAVNKPLPCVYNPTPIAELKKRHIPIVSYMPTRESRVAVKRKCSPDGIKPWLNIGTESSESQNVEVKYKPTVIVNSETRDSIQSYIPTFKSDSCSSNSNSCKDGSSNDYLFKLKEAYYPRSKKRREEYVPKKIKAPLKTADELNGSPLDQIEADYDMMDEALACARTTCDVQPPSEVSQDSFTDIEPKFSDDEEDDSNNQAKSEETSKISIASNDRVTSFMQKESHRYFEQFKCSNDLQRIDCINDRYNKNKPSNKIPKSEETVSAFPQRDTDRKVSEENVEKDAVKDIKEHKSARKDKTEKKNQKDHSSSHKKYKNKHESSERSHSTSHSKSKDKSKDRNHSKRESSKDVKDKKYDKDKRRSKDHDKHKEKERDKEKNESRQKSKSDKKGDHHRSDKRHEHSKSEKSKTDKSSEHLRTNRKSDDKYVERRNERNSIDKSANSLDNVRLDSMNDDDDVNDNCYSSIIDDALFSTSDSDHDVQEECLKIFQEYQVPKRLKPTETSTLRENEDEKQKEQNEEIGKKRVAHPSAATCVTRQIGLTPQVKKSVNPHQKMYERWRLMRDVAEKTTCSSISVPKDIRRNCTETIGSNDIKLNGNGRIRIAHVPYAKSLTIEKRKVTENAGKMMEAKAMDNCKTAAQTTKSGVRVAHVPQVIPQLMRPEPLQVATQKFPLNVRQYYLNMMHDVCVLIYTNAEDAAQRATKEEYACHERCKALAVYKNSCMLAAHRLRKEVEQNSSIENNVAAMPSSSSIVSHEAVLAGKSKGSWSVLRTKRSVTEFKGTALYNMMKKWIMTEQQLRDNGFPRPHPDGQKGRAKVYVINSRNQSVLSKVPNERICCRCGQSYMVDKQGLAVQSQNCIYHWGRKFTIRGESKYSCCQQYGSATGCCDARTHVWDYVDYENLRGYVKTFPKNAPTEEQGVYALDCEMCYTTQGLELTRITVIDEDCNVAYETLVKPQNTIIDYNTRFSGITEENMKNTTTSLLDVQATLLTMFSEKTILVGHSLESDLKALRLLHDTVVDTSVMFPHKNGYPQKRALKNLCSEYLRKIIQNDVGGHDSKEDAIACMELILWKAKEEAKLQ